MPSSAVPTRGPSLGHSQGSFLAPAWGEGDPRPHSTLLSRHLSEAILGSPPQCQDGSGLPSTPLCSEHAELASPAPHWLGAGVGRDAPEIKNSAACLSFPLWALFPLPLTLPIREANLSLRTFISSFSWFFCCWMAGSTLKSRGTSRLGFTVTLGMVPADQQPVRLRELKPSPGASQLPHSEVPGRGPPAGATSQLLRLLKPTTQERQAIAAPGPGAGRARG